LPETDGQGDDDSKPTTEDLAEPDHEKAYPPELLNNLIFRYEEPTTHSRWDKPLFTVPWSDPAPPVEEIWTAVTGITLERTAVPSTTSTSLLTPTTDTSSVSPSYPLDSDTASVAFTTATTIGGGRAARTKIKPHLATAQPLATDPTALYGFEKRSTAIVTAIRTFTQANPSAEAALARCQQLTTRSDQEGISIPVPETSTPVFIPAHIARSAPTDDLAGAGGILTLPRLQRLRRQWIGLNRSYAGTTRSSLGRGLRVDQVADAFVRFLNAELAGENAAS
jgi:protein KTI12